SRARFASHHKGTILNVLCYRNFHRQAGVAPGIKAADDVDHVLHTGALQQAAGNHAAISALAMDSERQARIEVRSRNFEMIQWEPCRLHNVPRLHSGSRRTSST